MKKEDVKYGAYVQILKEELVPAMGCTEPIALAYAAAKAREVLGEKPDKVRIGASGSIIKNVKCDFRTRRVARRHPPRASLPDVRRKNSKSLRMSP